MIEYAMNTTGMTLEQIEAAHAEMDGLELCTVCHLPIRVGDYPCISSPRSHQRGWNSVLSDECDIVQENGFHTPTRFTSKRELALALASKGLEQRVRHVTIPGTDHSPYTTDWGRGCVNLAAATAAVSEPRGKIHQPDAPSTDIPMTWTVGEWVPK